MKILLKILPHSRPKELTVGLIYLTVSQTVSQKTAVPQTRDHEKQSRLHWRHEKNKVGMDKEQTRKARD